MRSECKSFNKTVFMRNGYQHIYTVILKVGLNAMKEFIIMYGVAPGAKERNQIVKFF